jgi:hypothetical protein
MEDLDLEREPMILTPSESPTSDSYRLSSLQKYQVLAGDISAPEPTNPHDESLYQTILAEKRRATLWFYITSILFFLMIAVQIVLCLGIAIGAQLSMGNGMISILAGVNTGVAATIGVLKGLGLPEKKAIQRRRLAKAAEKIRFTTRKLRAGLPVNVVGEVEAVQRLEEEAVDSGHVDVTGVSTTSVKSLK